MKRTALLLLIAGVAFAQSEPPSRPARPAITIPMDGDDTDTYGLRPLEQACFQK